MLRFAGKNLNNLNVDNPNLNKSIDAVLHVDHAGIDKKVSGLKSGAELEILIKANDFDFKPLLKQYCNKTGREISTVSIDTITTLLKIHDESRVLSLLKQMSTENYCIEWLDTSPQILNKLMLIDPESYFIYAASNFFSLNNPACQSTTDNDTVDTNRKWAFLQDKVETRRNLCVLSIMDLKNKNLVIEANELMRRLLGLAKPQKQFIDRFFRAQNLLETSNSLYALQNFISDLKENLLFLIKKHFRSIRTNIESQWKKMYTISANDIEALKKEYSGLSQFHNQPKIKRQNQRVSIMLDLKNFLCDQGLDVKEAKTEAEKAALNIARERSDQSADTSPKHKPALASFSITKPALPTRPKTKITQLADTLPDFSTQNKTTKPVKKNLTLKTKTFKLKIRKK